VTPPSGRVEEMRRGEGEVRKTKVKLKRDRHLEQIRTVRGSPPTQLIVLVVTSCLHNCETGQVLPPPLHPSTLPGSLSSLSCFLSLLFFLWWAVTLSLLGFLLLLQPISGLRTNLFLLYCNVAFYIASGIVGFHSDKIITLAKRRRCRPGAILCTAALYKFAHFIFLYNYR
jgi:hypothetical protein